MIKTIIVGAGTYGQVYAEYIKETKMYNIIAFLDDDVSKQDLNILGIPVEGPISKLEEFEDKESIAVFVPIGNNGTRVRILKHAQKYSYQTPGFIHNTVQIHSTVKVGSCVYILPGTQIMPYTNIEDYVMISMGVNIAHHAALGSGCFLSQGVNVGASINIGENAFIGIASTLMTGIKFIGKGVIVGAHSLVNTDIPANVIAYGVPAKVIKEIGE